MSTLTPLELLAANATDLSVKERVIRGMMHELALHVGVEAKDDAVRLYHRAERLCSIVELNLKRPDDEREFLQSSIAMAVTLDPYGQNQRSS